MLQLSGKIFLNMEMLRTVQDLLWELAPALVPCLRKRDSSVI